MRPIPALGAGRRLRGASGTLRGPGAGGLRGRRPRLATTVPRVTVHTRGAFGTMFWFSVCPEYSVPQDNPDPVILGKAWLFGRGSHWTSGGAWVGWFGSSIVPTAAPCPRARPSAPDHPLWSGHWLCDLGWAPAHAECLSHLLREEAEPPGRGSQ